MTDRSLFDILMEWDVMLHIQGGYRDQDESGGVKRGGSAEEGCIVMVHAK